MAIHATGGYFFTEAVEIDIASGVLTPTQSVIEVDGEGGANDDLVTITPAAGFAVSGFQGLLILKAKTGITITVKHNTGNIALASGADFSLTGERTLMLFRINASAKWNDIAGSN